MTSSQESGAFRHRILIAICALFVGLVAGAATANTLEVDSDCNMALLPEVDGGNGNIDAPAAAQLLAFAEVGRDRCGLSSFPIWSLLNRYALRLSDFRVDVNTVGEQERVGLIGRHFQLMLEAEEEADQLFAIRGHEQGCRIILHEVGQHVRLD